MIAFLLDPKASHGQSTLFLKAFCEDLTQHIEAAGLARSVTVPELTDKTKVCFEQTTRSPDTNPCSSDIGLVIVRCAPTEATVATDTCKQPATKSRRLCNYHIRNVALGLFTSGPWVISR